MKKSIFFALFILIITVIWLGSGQFSNKKSVEKQPEKINNQNSSDNKSNTSISNINDNIIKAETQKFSSKKIDQTITLQGQSIYNRKIDIKSKTTGTIAKISYIRGDIVNKNKNLIEISIEDELEQLDSFEKELQLYQIEYNSIKKLVDQGLSSKSNLSLAALNLSKAKSKIKDIEIKINNKKINAPFEGIIDKNFIELGDYVQPGSVMLSIIDLNPIKIKGFLSEQDIDKINLGTQARIDTSNSNSKIGTITFISPTAETSTRTFEFIIEVKNKDLNFKSGVTSTITIEGSKIKAHKIPPSILTLKDDGTVGVKGINDQNFVVFYPTKTIKDTIDGMWVAGLPDNVNLIISGQEYISIGEKIN